MVQTSEMATVVAIIGSTNSVRAMPRPRKLEAKQTAAHTPRMTGKTTEAAVNTKVRAISHWKRSSVSILVEFAKPTNGVAPDPFQSCTDMNRVNTHGITITAAT